MKMYDMSNAKKIVGVLKVIAHYGNVVVDDGSIDVKVDNVTVFIPEQVEDIVNAVIGEQNDYVVREVCQILEEAALKNNWISKKDEELQRKTLLKIFGEPADDDGSNDDYNGENKSVKLDLSIIEDDKEENEWDDMFSHTRAYFEDNVDAAINRLMELPWGFVCFTKVQEYSNYAPEDVYRYVRADYSIHVLNSPHRDSLATYHEFYKELKWPYVDIEDRGITPIPIEFIKSLSLSQEAVNATLTCFMTRYHATVSYTELNEYHNRIEQERKWYWQEAGMAYHEWADESYRDGTADKIWEPFLCYLDAPANRPEKTIQKMTFAHGLMAFSRKGTVNNAQTLKKLMEDDSPQICCSLQGEEIGEIGIWVKGAVLSLCAKDAASWTENGSRHCYLWHNKLLKTVKELQETPPDGHHEAILKPLRIVGVWAKKDADDKNKKDALKIACLFHTTLTVI